MFRRLREHAVDWRRHRLYTAWINQPVPVVIFRYHSIGDKPAVAAYADPELSVSPAQFRQQIEFLAGHFSIVTLDELPEMRARSRGKPYAIITFDDGYTDNYEVAMPILRAIGVPAICYVTTAPFAKGTALWTSVLWRSVANLAGELAVDIPEHSVSRITIPADREARGPALSELTVRLSGTVATERWEIVCRIAAAADVDPAALRPATMTVAQIKAMAAAGFSIGAHTRTHPHLNRVPEKEHASEVEGSRADLESIGVPVRHFAYPNPGGGGSVSDIARRSVESARFETAVTSRPIPPRHTEWDRLRIPRVGVYRGRQSDVLFSTLRTHLS